MAEFARTKLEFLRGFLKLEHGAPSHDTFSRLFRLLGDQARSRMDHAPQNLAILRHMALNLVRRETSKGSLRKKFRPAAWSDSFLAKVLAQI
jgi:hypothetical protein